MYTNSTSLFLMCSNVTSHVLMTRVLILLDLFKFTFKRPVQSTGVQSMADFKTRVVILYV